MRKKNRRNAAPRSSGHQALQLSRETIRSLTPEQLSQVVHGNDITCPTGTESDKTKKTPNM